MLQTLRFMAASTLVFACAATTTAQSDDSQSAKQQDGTVNADDSVADDGGILAGPKVREEEVEGQGGSFMTDRRRASDSVTVPAERWMRMLGELELSEEQLIAIRAIQEAFSSSAQEFRRVYGEELSSFERRFREARRDGVDLPRDELAKFAALRAQAPRIESSQEEIWELLSAEQQDRFRGLLAVERERMAERRRMLRERREGMAETDDPAMRDADDDATAMRQRSRDSAGEMMDDGMMDAMTGGADDAAAADEQQADRPQAQPRPLTDTALDAAGERRVKFLRRFQKYRPRGAAPGDEARRFDFDD